MKEQIEATRLKLCEKPDKVTFLSFYYLKEELVEFCKQHGLPASGSKIEITERIAHYLETGEILPVKSVKRKAAVVHSITKATLIEENIICSEVHRSFFEEQIGKSFSFKVAFQKCLKENSGKTYGEAIIAYEQIKQAKKKYWANE